MKKYQLRVYVMGRTMQSQRAINNIRSMYDEHFQGTHVLSIIDLEENPDIAENPPVLATPALVAETPSGSIAQIIGSFSQQAHIASMLSTDRIVEASIHKDSLPAGGPTPDDGNSGSGKTAPSAIQKWS